MNNAQYHEAAMRTAAGPEVFHFPTDNVDAGEMLDAEFINDAMSYLQAAAKMDDWKSRFFYGKPKYHRTGLDSAELEATIKPFPIYEDFAEGEMSLEFIANPQLIHAILGLATEGAELIEDLLKLMRPDYTSMKEGTRQLDYEKAAGIGSNIAREAGDIQWFAELLSKAINVPTDDIRTLNIARLAKRYPEKFSEEAGLARADEQS